MQEVINAVVIDNEIEDIIGVTTALAELGISTLPVHYKDPTAARELCKNISKASPRVIITDIQLRDGGKDPSTTDLSNVALCLAEIVEETKGPYVVLAWTTKPESLAALKDRVIQYFDAKGIRHPIYFDGISKNDCSIAEKEYSAEKILEHFGAHLANQASIRALMFWECSVLEAAIDSVNTLSSLDPSTLPQSLKSLAESVAGSNLKGFEAIAINEAFSYVLKDKLGLLSFSNKAKGMWGDVFKEADGEIPEVSKHRLNTLLHVEDTPQAGIVCPGDVWVVEKPKMLFRQFEVPNSGNDLVGKLINEFITIRSHGHNLNNSARAETNVELKSDLTAHYKHLYETPLENTKKACRVAMIEISPACDFANQKKPLKTVALGILLPVEEISDVIEIKQTPSTIHVKVMLEDKEYLLGFSAKYITALSEKLIAVENLNLDKTMRIRESLLQSWIHGFAAYNSRIGTVSFQ